MHTIVYQKLLINLSVLSAAHVIGCLRKLLCGYVLHSIIADAHKDSLHASPNQITNELRKRLWIVGMKTKVKSIVSKCLACRRFHARPGEQQMAPLPSSRVALSQNPFTVAGSDLFGPMMIKIGRSQHKRYVCIFVCHSSRAVHLEVLHSLNTDSYIGGFRRFVARRGHVDRLVLDQGTNQRGASRELDQAIRQWNASELGRRFHQFGTESSHAAGATERIIRIIRSHLRHVLNEQVLSEESFQTLVVECESIANFRPLTAASENADDFRAICPNDLLLVRPSQSLPPWNFPEDVRFVRQWKQVQGLANSFWKRLRDSYLPLLQKRQKWLQSRRSS